MSTCARCGAPHGEGAETYSACGAPLRPRAPESVNAWLYGARGAQP